MTDVIDPRSVMPAGPPEPPAPAAPRSAMDAARPAAGVPRGRLFKMRLFRTPAERGTHGDITMRGQPVGWLGVTRLGALFPGYAILETDERMAVTFRLEDGFPGHSYYRASDVGLVQAGAWFSLSRNRYAAFFSYTGFPGQPNDYSNLRDIYYDELSQTLTCEDQKLSYYDYSRGGDYLYFYDGYHPVYVEIVEV
jgi:hypothetical protein